MLMVIFGQDYFNTLATTLTLTLDSVIVLVVAGYLLTKKS
jgi:hypothetical protein